MNFQLNTLNTHLPQELSALTLDFLKVNVIRSQPLLCPRCGVNQAERNGGSWKDIYHCYDCRKALIGRPPFLTNGREKLRVVIYEDLETSVDISLETSQEGWEFPPPAYDKDWANGFPVQFVWSDELYWGPAASGYR